MLRGTRLPISKLWDTMHRRIRARVAALIAVVPLLAACSHPRPAARNAPLSHEEMRLAFRASFMSSCEKGVPGAKGLAYCTCADDRLESTFTDAELAKLTPDNAKLRVVTHACAKKAGLTIRAGR